MITLETLSANVSELMADTLKRLADPDTDKNTVAYLRGTLGACLIVTAWIKAIPAENETKSEAADETNADETEEST